MKRTRAEKEIARTAVKIIGCGGIGGWLVDPLTRFLTFSCPEVLTLHLIDGDRYEEKDRERQQFDHVGNKATMTAVRLRKRFPGRLSFFDHPTYISQGNVTTFVEDRDTIFLCVDNCKTKKLVSDRMGELKNGSVISGGSSERYGLIQVYARKNGVDYTAPLANKYHREILSPKDENPADVLGETIRPRTRVHMPPGLLVTDLAVASMMLNFYFATTLIGRKFGYVEAYIDVLNGQARSVERERRADC